MNIDIMWLFNLGYNSVKIGSRLTGNTETERL